MALDVVTDVVEAEEGGEQVPDLIREVLSLWYENSAYTPVV
jgi:hypothetical protein